ncbi:hypothetical protein EE074_29635, partial [Klebsiella pneumoniae]|nr:hypothetical protein [Klebsiella pneumoniae]
MHIDLESSSEDESNARDMVISTLGGSKLNKTPTFQITLEPDSDEDRVHNKNKDESESNLYLNLQRFVKTLSLTPLYSNTVAGLNVKMAPRLEGETSKPRCFVKSSYSENTPDVILEDTSLNELIELPFDCYPLGVKSLIKKGFVPSSWSKGEAQHREHIWETKYFRNNKDRNGIGFGTVGPLDDHEYCAVITNNLESDSIFTGSVNSFNGACLETSNDTEDFQVRDAPPELEEEIRSTIDELREINLGTNQDPRPTFISSLLNETESNDFVRLLSEFKDCF